jgi:hypothetical protein
VNSIEVASELTEKKLLSNIPMIPFNGCIQWYHCVYLGSRRERRSMTTQYRIKMTTKYRNNERFGEGNFIYLMTKDEWKQAMMDIFRDWYTGYREHTILDGDEPLSFDDWVNVQLELGLEEVES